MVRAENYQRQAKAYHDKRVRPLYFQVGDYVLRRREASKPLDGGKLAKRWEGPYIVLAVVRPGSYKLKTPKAECETGERITTGGNPGSKRAMGGGRLSPVLRIHVLQGEPPGLGPGLRIHELQGEPPGLGVEGRVPAPYVGEMTEKSYSRHLASLLSHQKRSPTHAVLLPPRRTEKGAPPRPPAALHRPLAVNGGEASVSFHRRFTKPLHPAAATLRREAKTREKIVGGRGKSKAVVEHEPATAVITLRRRDYTNAARCSLPLNAGPWSSPLPCSVVQRRIEGKRRSVTIYRCLTPPTLTATTPPTLLSR
nr:uncharacterized protein LOC109168246 [Ipomoea batatas]